MKVEKSESVGLGQVRLSYWTKVTGSILMLGDFICHWARQEGHGDVVAFMCNKSGHFLSRGKGVWIMTPATLGGEKAKQVERAMFLIHSVQQE